MRTLYLKDSSNRSRQFALTTRICIENGKKVVIKEPCFPEGKPHIERIVESQKMFAKYYKNVEISKTWVEDDMLYAEYINGIPLSDFYLKAIQNNDKDEIIRLLKFHLELVLGRNNSCIFKTTKDFVKIFGETNSFEGESALIFTFFDPLPENIIFINGDINRPCFIDYEWFFDFPLPISILKFRFAQQFSLLSGMNEIMPLDERLNNINYFFSKQGGSEYNTKFIDFVFKDESIDYSYQNQIKKYEKNILQYPEIIIQNLILYFNTGDGYSEDKKSSYSFTGNQVEISCSIPENTVSVRLDPIEGYGCVIRDLEILSYSGIIRYEPINGYKYDNGDIVFVNTDPIIEIKGAISQIKIRYFILLLSEFFHYRIFNNYIYTYQKQNKLIAECDSLITERNELVTERDSLIAENNNFIAIHPELLTQNCKLFFDIGNGYSENETQGYSITGNEVDISCQVPENTVAVRLDPVEGYGCIISNLEVLSYNGVVKYEPINGYKNEFGDMVFTNIDPQIELQNVSYLLKIKYRIFFLSDFSHYRVLNNFIVICKERNSLATERDSLVTERNGLMAERDGLVNERNGLTAERDGLVNERNSLTTERDGLVNERNSLTAERDGLVNERNSLTAERDSLVNERNSLTAERDGLVNERNSLVSVRNSLVTERDLLTTERDGLVNERNELITHRDSLVTERNGLVTERDILTTERNNVINSRSWRITKPLRNIGAFIRRNKILYFFAKGIFSSKRKGIKKTTKKIANYKQKQVQNQSSLPVTNTFSSEAERVTHENNLFSSKIKFSIIVPLYDTHLPFLHQLIDSVRSQTYNNWELCLADGSPNNSEIEEICNKYIKNDSRIRYKHLETNLGISGNSNEAISMSTGDYIVLCDHDDILFSNALYENAIAIQETNADVLYSDEDFVDIKGTKHYYPFYKPDWSRDMLYSQMYICHLLVIRKEILDKTGWFNKEFDGSQDYDLMLRLSEHTELIYHIPKLLYSWRAVPTSTSINAASKTYAQDAGLNALNAHLLRKFNNMAHAYPTSELFVYEARFDTMQNKPLVSILIPMRDKAELTDQCIQSIINKSTYENFEIIIINNRSTEQNTFNWFDKIKKQESRISIIDADIEFNWSKINNIGIQHAKGIVYIFLNNDTIIITPDWIERLCENALRADIGAVGSLLLYEDGTIQHAGVVVGMNSWADHVFKGMLPANSRSPFVSPAISRNVLAVTGACMAVSRHTIEKIGTLNEDFIICGSDVEFCIRAYENGLSNLYNANVKLYHLESKSRDSFIPENDFEMSYKTYKTYRENIDPYFNPNLDINTAIPTVNTGENMNIQSFKNFLKRNETIYKLTKRMHTTIQNQIQKIEFSTDIPEVTPIGVRIDKILSDRKRLNLLIPSLDIKHVFGGISTALGFFQTLCDKTDTDIRIIITDAPFDKENSILLNGYEMVNSNEDSSYPKQIIECYNRYGKTLPVGKNDIFVATAWWTAYNIYSIIHWQEKTFNVYNSLIYLIQDYEPGFYSWSSRYLMAESTYKNNISTIAVFNSRLLYDFFKIRGYLFKQEYYFDPVLNNSLREYLISEKIPMRKKQVIIYGRPSTPRNAFELIVASLKLWTAQQPNIQEWNILSVGETHPEIELSNGIIMKSIGKLSLEKYALLLKETYMGISLMVSPHPSYPPLEMSTFGVRTITNRYANKDLSNFNENVISLDNVSAENIAENLTQLADEYPNGSINITKSDYTEHPEDIFSDICENIIHLIL